MAKYFTISHGLRGCYMPDSDPFVLQCTTRRELKAVIMEHAHTLDSGATQGFSRRAIASFAAACWREAHKQKPAYLPYALPYREPDESHYHNAIFCSVATRRAFLEYQANAD